MSAILVLTRLYITESVRRQLHLITLFLAVLMLVLPNLINAFGMTGFDRVTKDVGLTLLGLGCLEHFLHAVEVHLVALDRGRGALERVELDLVFLAPLVAVNPDHVFIGGEGAAGAEGEEQRPEDQQQRPVKAEADRLRGADVQGVSDWYE